MAEKKKRRTFRKYTFRGVDLDQLLDMTRFVQVRKALKQSSSSSSSSAVHKTRTHTKEIAFSQGQSQTGITYNFYFFVVVQVEDSTVCAETVERF